MTQKRVKCIITLSKKTSDDIRQLRKNHCPFISNNADLFSIMIERTPINEWILFLIEIRDESVKELNSKEVKVRGWGSYTT